MTPPICLFMCFIVFVFFLGGGGGEGGEPLCFARIFKEPIMLRHSCEKPVKLYYFERCGFQSAKNSVLTTLILREKFSFSLNKHTIQMLV